MILRKPLFILVLIFDATSDALPAIFFLRNMRLDGSFQQTLLQIVVLIVAALLLVSMSVFFSD